MNRTIEVTASVLMLLMTGSVCGAQNFSDIEQNIFAGETISGFTENLSGLEKSVASAGTSDDIDKINRELASLDLRFDTFYSIHMNEFAECSPVMDAIAKYNEKRSAIDGALTAATVRIEAKNTLAETGKYLARADSTYAKYLKTAKKMSLTKQSAKLLDKLKAKEKMEFAKVQAKYEAASAAVASIPELEEDFAALEEKFTNISVNSGLIQKMEYKSPMQRAKDWLMSLAAVAILLMFVNMIQARISAFKKEKESLKKMREALGENDKDIPTI